MRRTIIATAWIAGTTVPLLLAVVIIFGCCVLPFHGVIHKAMPLCNLAIDFMRGEHHDHRTPATPSTKQEPVKRIVTEVPRAFQLVASTTGQRTLAVAAATSYRSFIALGAVRCDRDVGLHLILATFLI